eukprot:Rmarinus@m.13463
MAGEGWDTQADYIRQKDRKLKEQYLDEFRESRETNSLFRGVSVWVNGRTPGVTAAELKAIICGGGGTWEAYYRRSKVTHVIASTLPVEKLKVAKSLPPVVTAEWVLDSKRAGRLLPVHQYIIPALRSPLKKQVLHLRLFLGNSESICGYGIFRRQQGKNSTAPYRTTRLSAD